MKDLLTKLLWRNPEIDEAASRLKKELPGFSEAEREFEALAEEIRAIAGYALYDRYVSRLMRYSDYEVRAYYALGLGLRGEMVQALDL